MCASFLEFFKDPSLDGVDDAITVITLSLFIFSNRFSEGISHWVP